MGETHVLVAEDDPKVRSILERHLEAAGYRVAAFADGAQALAWVERGEPLDLAITDLDMPVLAGDALLVELKRRAPRVPVIVVTAVHDQKKVEDCFAQDAYRWLPKPFTKSELLQTVEQALSEARARARAREEAPDEVTPRPRIRRDLDGWVELTAPSRQEYLDRFQEFTDALLASKLHEKARNELKIAVQELGQNAIEWGNKLDRNSKIKIAWKLLEDRILIRIADEGPGFDPGTVPDPTVDPIAIIEQRERLGKRPGGFGIHLARRVMDKVTYNERGNEVVLEKRF
jgi:CheY-like chemotaxis protein/anti-sigma regulatory factor (Ser/Thr protein kinase)